MTEKQKRDQEAQTVETLSHYVQFAERVNDMMHAQETYFRTRTKDDLLKSKGMEKEIRVRLKLLGFK